MKKTALTLTTILYLSACGQSIDANKKQAVPAQTPAQPTVAPDNMLERVSIIASADDAGQSLDGKHRMQLSSKEAKDVAEKTFTFLRDSDGLIQKGMQAQSDELSSKGKTAFTILGMWPKADEMAKYNVCEMSLRNLARISFIRQAALMANDANRSKQLADVADSLVDSYRSNAISCGNSV